MGLWPRTYSSQEPVEIPCATYFELFGAFFHQAVGRFSPDPLAFSRESAVNEGSLPRPRLRMCKIADRGGLEPS